MAERARAALAVLATLLLAAGCAEPELAASRTVDDARLRAAADEPGSWLTYGGTYAEEHYSPLAQIDTGNVAELGLAWSFDLATERGVQATPLVEGDTLYVTAPWSIVYALDAATGAQRWRFDPGVPRSIAKQLCCGVPNRGVALWGDNVYVGTLDGNLIALDARTGEPVWKTLTVDPEQPYSITGAPRAVEGKIIIGNAGADYGVRGYVSAYDAATGELVWRTYTVPGNPADGFETPALERAAETWTGEWWKIGGGGGTVYDAMAYDPELRLLYVGTGNGVPYPRWLRSPGGGDNLYLASILALRPDTGEQIWHYQTTPAETWDYTATQPLILADLELGGRPRRVILQAPKNGFFFVLDRETGEFLSAEPLVDVNWTSGYDAAGRPLETDVDYREEARVVLPSPLGAHSWEPMSYSPRTGLVYIPVLHMAGLMKADAEWRYRPGFYNSGLDVRAFEQFGADAEAEFKGQLVAWDPREQRAAWRADQVTGGSGGTLATAGDLVFQASSDGRFVAYRAGDGETLWESPLGTGGGGGPVSYLAGGEQFVAVAAGWGSSFAMSSAAAARRAGVRGGGRVLAYKLGGRATPPPARRAPLGPVPAPGFRVEASDQERLWGSRLYHTHCSTCHGAVAIGGGSGVPDLRYTTAAIHARFSKIVLGGERIAQGMPEFSDRLNADEVRWIQAWILQRAADSAGRD